METNPIGIATIGLRGGSSIKRRYDKILQIFDPEHGPTTIFVRIKEEEITICSIHEETDRFVRDESIAPKELKKLEKESKIYLEEGTEEEIAGLNDQIEETFLGGLGTPFPKQTGKLDIMFS